MKKPYIAIACALLLPATAAAGWFGFPETTAKVMIDLNNYSAGLSRQTVQTEIGPISYIEGGDGPTVVLVHGIYARKEHWVEVARHLVDDYRVVALDLPGFGDNPNLPDGAYHLREQQRHLSLVFAALELKNVHIGANSMGALVAGLLAAEEHDRVASLAFIGSPLGVPSAVQSDMEIALGDGKIPLLVQSSEAFDARNAWLSPNAIQIPSPILKTWRDAEIAQADMNERIWHEVHDLGRVPNLLDLAPELAMPALIIWCKEDRIFHVSGAGELRDRLPNARVDVLGGCGHVPMIDKPDTVASTYREFLSSLYH